MDVACLPLCPASSKGAAREGAARVSARVLGANRGELDRQLGKQAKPESALYRTIRSQPEAVRAVIEGTGEEVAAAGEVLLTARPVFLVGTGTSSHAAAVG